MDDERERLMAEQERLLASGVPIEDLVKLDVGEVYEAPAVPDPGPPWLLVVQMPDEESLVASLEAMPNSVVAQAFCADIALQVEHLVSGLPTYERKARTPTVLDPDAPSEPR